MDFRPQKRSSRRACFVSGLIAARNVWTCLLGTTVDEEIISICWHLPSPFRSNHTFSLRSLIVSSMKTVITEGAEKKETR